MSKELVYQATIDGTAMQHPAAGTTTGFAVTVDRTPTATLNLAGITGDHTVTAGDADGTALTGAGGTVRRAFSTTITPAAGHRWQTAPTNSDPRTFTAPAGTFNGNVLNETINVNVDAVEDVPLPGLISCSVDAATGVNFLGNVSYNGNITVNWSPGRTFPAAVLTVLLQVQ